MQMSHADLVNLFLENACSDPILNNGLQPMPAASAPPCAS